MTERTTHEWARRHADLDWPVYPVEPGGKRPQYRGWQCDATIDPDLIARTGRREPGPNIGTIGGEAFDVDIAYVDCFRQAVTSHPGPMVGVVGHDERADAPQTLAACAVDAHVARLGATR